MTSSKKVVIAMSGGVDSSVAAALLIEQGYEVIGMMMRLWTESGREAHNRCCTPEAMARARQIAAQLDIPFYAIDAQQPFHDTVVNYFIEGYLNGNTPNPCLMCNRHIRWEFLLNHALNMGADYMATGHYAQTIRDSSGLVKLMRAVDDNKDQSYVLSVLNQDQLKHAIFPLGELTKPQVRIYAKKHNLPVASIKDSQDLCFLAGTDYKSFLLRNAPETSTPGEILDSDGEVIGEHDGLAFYTLGQRKGLGVTQAQPLYVIDKNIKENQLIVGDKSKLGHMQLRATQLNWISGIAPDKSFRGNVKIRYSSQHYDAQITIQAEDEILVEFDESVPAVTPGQAAVIYIEDEVIGFSIITGNQLKTNQYESELISLELIS